MASGTKFYPTNHFILLCGQYSLVDTVNFYMANNIFGENGLTSFLHFQGDFTIYGGLQYRLQFLKLY